MATTKISPLTQEQEKLLVEYRNRWEKLSLCTDPANLEAAYEPLCRIYTERGFKPLPKNRVFKASGPMAALLMALYINSIIDAKVEGTQKPGRVNKVPLPASKVFTKIDAAALLGRDEAWSAKICEEVVNEVRSKYEPWEWAGVIAEPVSKDDATLLINDMIFGVMEASWMGWYDFVGTVLKVPEVAPIRSLIDFSIHTGWFTLYQQCAIIQDRASDMHFNDQPTGHCETGPALAFRDGLRFWYINGIEVDEKIVMAPETQTIEEIDSDPNNDRRALRIQRFGWVRYLKESGAKVLDQRNHPRDGTEETLYQMKDGARRIVVVDPATNEKVCLSVSTDVNTCDEAQNWMNHGLDGLAMVRT